MSKTSNKYDRLFKEKALQLIQEKSVIKVAQDIGVPRSTLFRWRLEHQKFGITCFCGTGYGQIRLNPEQKRIKVLTKKIKVYQRKVEILKDGGKYVAQGRLMAFNFIKNNEKLYSIKLMCKVLKIGELSYYNWRKQFISETKQKRNLLEEEITSIFFEFKQKHGVNTIAIELQKRGFIVPLGTVSRYMAKLGLHYKRNKKFIITTNSNHNIFIVPNVLNGKFTVKEPSKIWVSDITYIRIKNGFMYLTIILDLFDRKIIGWHLDDELTTLKTTIPAWKMAVNNRKIQHELIFHSDRGVQYANKSFTEILDSHKNVVRSMSRRGIFWDNIIAENFFSTLKRELIYRNELFTNEQLKVEIFEFIENFYNKKRRHSFLKYKTIEEFDKLKNIL